MIWYYITISGGSRHFFDSVVSSNNLVLYNSTTILSSQLTRPFPLPFVTVIELIWSVLFPIWYYITISGGNRHFFDLVLSSNDLVLYNLTTIGSSQLTRPFPLPIVTVIDLIWSVLFPIWYYITVSGGNRHFFDSVVSSNDLVLYNLLAIGLLDMKSLHTSLDLHVSSSAP